MSMEQTIIVGIISSVIASLFFYLWMIVIKPRFIISDKMCKEKNEEGETVYMVKIANTKRSFITDVVYSLVYCVEGSDDLTDIQTIKPQKEPVSYIDKYSKKHTDYAIRISYLIDENKYPTNESSYFLFTFQGTHAFSNSTKIETRKYKKEDIQEGIFETGKSTKILTTR